MLLLRAGKAAPRESPAFVLLQRRWLNVHEYQGAELLRAAGVNVPPGIACRTAEEVAAAAASLGAPSGEVVLKSQVLAGGRGLGTFTNGLQGGVHVVKARALSTLASLSQQPYVGRLQTRPRSRSACWAARW